nr:hypothetical protein [Tanacetum cinerariifolium]
RPLHAISHLHSRRIPATSDTTPPPTLPSKHPHSATHTNHLLPPHPLHTTTFTATTISPIHHHHIVIIATTAAITAANDMQQQKPPSLPSSPTTPSSPLTMHHRGCHIRVPPPLRPLDLFSLMFVPPSMFGLINHHHNRTFEKKQKSRRKQRKEIEVPHIEPQTEESVPTPSNDPLPSGEDRMQLTELMNLCTNLQKQVLDLEKAKTTQAKEIADLKKRVKKLKRKKKGRIVEIDADEDLFLIDKTAQDQGRLNEEEMFGVYDLDGDELIMYVTTGENIKQDATVAKKEVSTAADEVVTTAEDVKVTTAAVTTQISKDDVTLTQTLIEIKAAKPKARGVKDKGKGIMVEPKKPLKKKEQIMTDKEVARKLETQMKAEMEKEERIEREKDEANIALIEEWDDVQATIDADKQLVEQL